MLIINNLSVSIADTLVLKNLNLAVDAGSMHAIMGPNGSGKSSLALTIAGHPRYQINSGEIQFLKICINNLAPEKRAQMGLFLTFQNPYEIPGLNIFTFLMESYRALKGDIPDLHDFKARVIEALELVGLSNSFIDRNVNEGFSGGERKRFELAQLMLFKPRLAILDEIDSGLDVDAAKRVATSLNYFKQNNPDSSIILITHYQRILNTLAIDAVHIVMNGTLVQSGSIELACNIEQLGYNAT